jgi:hypothetical protein
MTTIDRQTIQPLTDDWDWQLSAACRGMDVEIFYHPAGERLSEKTARINWAKQICCRCAVINECALWALKTREPYGIWGRACPRRSGQGCWAFRACATRPLSLQCSAARRQRQQSNSADPLTGVERLAAAQTVSLLNVLRSNGLQRFHRDLLRGCRSAPPDLPGHAQLSAGAAKVRSRPGGRWPRRRRSRPLPCHWRSGTHRSRRTPQGFRSSRRR